MNPMTATCVNPGRTSLRIIFRNLSQCLPKCVTALAQLVFAFTEERPDKALERLRQRCIQDVTLVLVELAGRKQAARRD